MNIDKKLLYQGVLGLAIGDALGVPAEFKSRTQLQRNPITEFVGGGCWNQKPGTWSDDTSMTLATIDALNKHNWEVDDSTLYDIMENFRRWYIDGDYAAYRIRFDIGNTCEKAIRDWYRHILRGNDNFICTGVGNKAYGNGSLMRILPCMFLTLRNTIQISNLTHYDTSVNLCGECCELYIRFLKNLMKFDNKFEAFAVTFDETYDIFNVQESNLKNTSKIFNSTDETDFINLDETAINSSGYVVDTLEAAIWCFLNTDSYKECVLKAVNLGEDTDTVAAVAGGLAGVYYGIGGSNGIPREWVQQLRDETTLRRICFNN